MRNPYATSPAGEASPQATQFSSRETSRSRDYHDAIGPNAEYYVPLFEDFDARGPRISWNWPAFFVTSAWYVYRKLYLVGLLNFIYPFVLWFVLGLLIALRVLQPATGGAAILLLTPLPWIVLTLFANRIYWRRISGLIEDTPASEPDHRSRLLAKAGGVSFVGRIIMVVLTVLYVVAMIGILAAIAIPAYQDYTIRSQVTEGLNRATAVKMQVAEFREANGAWPNQEDLAARADLGRYLDSLHVEDGSVVITYGNAANRVIAGKRIVLLPGVLPNGEVVWACGGSSLPDGAQPGDGPHGSELPIKYMPRACRPD